MCILKKLFKKRNEKIETTEEVTPGIQEPWFNDVNASERGSFFKSKRDPYTGKKKKPMMDLVYNCVPGNSQDSNSIHKSGV